MAFNATQPTVVVLNMALAVAVHAREQHILCIDRLILSADYKVGVGLVGTLLLTALIDGGALIHLHMTRLVDLIFRVVGLSPKQRTVAVLVAAQVVTQREDIFW